MKLEVTIKTVLELAKGDASALENATPAELIQTAQMQNAKLNIEIKKK